MAATVPIITLITDFGGSGSYVGVMKGVILSITPQARLVDITHQINPQDIQQAASVLATVYPYFPAHTVHLVVVDPGVGGARRPIAVETPHGRFVAPDNGVLTQVLLRAERWQVVALDNPAFWRAAPSHTFHGRDIFSPAAAHLAGGRALSELGTAIDDPVQLAPPQLEVTERFIRGRVVHIDHFGNVLTDITRLSWLADGTVRFEPLDPRLEAQPPLCFEAASARVSFGWHVIEGMRHNYGEAPAKRPVALISSSGELEIAVNQGSAQNELGAKLGDPVTLFFTR